MIATGNSSFNFDIPCLFFLSKDSKDGRFQDRPKRWVVGSPFAAPGCGDGTFDVQSFRESHLATPRPAGHAGHCYREGGLVMRPPGDVGGPRGKTEKGDFSSRIFSDK